MCGMDLSLDWWGLGPNGGARLSKDPNAFARRFVFTWQGTLLDPGRADLSDEASVFINESGR
jgi:hypothetical protein